MLIALTEISIYDFHSFCVSCIALVLEQVNNFGSLPHRKQSYKKPLRRSKSDASSSKKPKRNSIFNFFNSIPASSTNSISSTNQNNQNNNSNNSNSNNNNEKVVNSSKKVARSKSDTSSQSLKNRREKYSNKLHLSQNSTNKSNNENNAISSDSDNNTSSSILTNSLRKKKLQIPLTPITEVATPLPDDRNSTDYFGASSNNNCTTNTINTLTEGGTEDCENPLKNRNSSSSSSNNHNKKYLSKSMESMHSSQMPVEKLPLTKNVRVDKIIKRLSVERLSPPPLAVLQAGGFSYTNPQLSPKSPTTTITGLTNNININQDNKTPPDFETRGDEHATNSQNPKNNHIVYTQVVCNEKNNADVGLKTIPNDNTEQTVHSTLKTSRKSAASPTNLIISKHNIKNNHSNEYNEHSIRNDFINTVTPDEQRNFIKKHQQHQQSEEDFGRDETDNFASTNEEEPIIKANIRKQIPRYPSNTNIDLIHNSYNHQQQQQNYSLLDNEFDRLNEMRETDYNGIDATLSSRREILESRIKSRIGGLHHINNDNSHTRSNPPTTFNKQRTYSNKHGSNEFINNRFSPERKHLDFNKSSSPTVTKYEHQNKTSTTYLDDGSTIIKKSTFTPKYNDKYTDSGNETDIVVKNNNNNNRNRYSSRFNIGYLLTHAHVFVLFGDFARREQLVVVIVLLPYKYF